MVLIEQKIFDYDGVTVLRERGNDPTSSELTYRTAIGSLLQNVTQEDTADLKAKLFQISTKLWASKEPDFTAEQITLINDRVGKFGTPLIIGRVAEFLEPKKKTEEKPVA